MGTKMPAWRISDVILKHQPSAWLERRHFVNAHAYFPSSCVCCLLRPALAIQGSCEQGRGPPRRGPQLNLCHSWQKPYESFLSGAITIDMSVVITGFATLWIRNRQLILCECRHITHMGKFTVPCLQRSLYLLLLWSISLGTAAMRLPVSMSLAATSV